MVLKYIVYNNSLSEQRESQVPRKIDVYNLLKRYKEYTNSTIKREVSGDDSILELVNSAMLHTFEDTKNPYYCLPLTPPEKKLLLDGFSLNHRPEHHLTFCMGSFHYTYVCHTENGKYTLHVHLNINEMANKKAELKFTDKQTGRHTPKDIQEISIVTQYAIDQSKPLLDKLEKLQQYFYAQIEETKEQHREHYKSFHNAHLSDAHTNELCEHLENSIQAINKLIILDDKPKSYLIKKTHLQNMIDKLRASEYSNNQEDLPHLKEEKSINENQKNTDAVIEALATEYETTINNTVIKLREMYAPPTARKSSKKKKPIAIFSKSEEPVINNGFLAWVREPVDIDQKLNQQISNFPPSKNTELLISLQQIQEKHQKEHMDFMLNIIKQIFRSAENSEQIAETLEYCSTWISALSKEDANTILANLIERDKGKLLVALVNNYSFTNTNPYSETKATFFSSSLQPCLIEQIIRRQAFNCLLEMNNNEVIDFLKNGTDGKPLSYAFFKHEATDSFTIKCTFNILYSLPNSFYIELISILEQSQDYNNIDYIKAMLALKKRNSAAIAAITSEDFKLLEQFSTDSNLKIIETDISEDKSRFYSLRISCYLSQLNKDFPVEIDDFQKRCLKFRPITPVEKINSNDLHANLGFMMSQKADSESDEAKTALLMFNMHNALFNYLHIIVTAINNYQRGFITRSELELERNKSDFYRKEFVKWETCHQRTDKVTNALYQVTQKLAACKQKIADVVFQKNNPTPQKIKIENQLKNIELQKMALDILSERKKVILNLERTLRQQKEAEENREKNLLHNLEQEKREVVNETKKILAYQMRNPDLFTIDEDEVNDAYQNDINLLDCLIDKLELEALIEHGLRID